MLHRLVVPCLLAFFYTLLEGSFGLGPASCQHSQLKTWAWSSLMVFLHQQ